MKGVKKIVFVIVEGPSNERATETEYSLTDIRTRNIERIVQRNSLRQT